MSQTVSLPEGKSHQGLEIPWWKSTVWRRRITFHRGPGAQCAPLCDPPSCKTSCSGGPGISHGDSMVISGDFHGNFLGFQDWWKWWFSGFSGIQWKRCWLGILWGFSWKFMRLTFITRVVWYSDQLKDFFLALDEPLPSDKMGGHRSHRWWLQVDQVLRKTGNIFVSQPLKIHHS